MYTACAAGTYSDLMVPLAALTVLLERPVQAGCDRSAHRAVLVTSGAAATACTIVPEGYYPVNANTGQATNSEASGTLACGQGRYSLSGHTTCTACSEGYFQSNVGQSTCSQVPAGSYAVGADGIGTNSAAVGNTNCAAGRYSVAGASVCTPNALPVSTLVVREPASATRYKQGILLLSLDLLWHQRQLDSRNVLLAGYSHAAASECTACSEGFSFTRVLPNAPKALVDTTRPMEVEQVSILQLQHPKTAGRYSVAGASVCSSSGVL